MNDPFNSRHQKLVIMQMWSEGFLTFWCVLACPHAESSTCGSSLQILLMGWTHVPK